ncbi:MAG: DUF1629 domain-containing protein [Planctomycetota bacterium]
MSTFFEVVTDDITFANRWFLDEPLTTASEAIDARLFRYGVSYHNHAPHRVPIQQEGVRVEFNLGAFDMPVVSREVLDHIPPAYLTDCEIYPVVIGNGVNGFSILNVVRRIACVDELRSSIMKWNVEDERPDKIGCYRAVGDLHIVSSLAREYDIFRIDGWEVPLIVSERFKSSIEDISNLGISFVPVT